MLNRCKLSCQVREISTVVDTVVVDESQKEVLDSQQSVTEKENNCFHDQCVLTCYK